MSDFKEALYYEKLPGNKVRCLLCPHVCFIEEGHAGKCRSRLNRNGTLYATNYGNTVSMSLDPIEKKPLYHYFPDSDILSLGPNTCNLSCTFCQNYEISQFEVNTMQISPEQLLEYLSKRGMKQVAFTYTEPLMWFEYILDCAKLFKEKDIRIVMVSNGFINPEPLKDLQPCIDAWNIDLKSMDETFYTDICGAHLKPVLNTIEQVSRTAHIEITNLLIPGRNDSDDQIQRLVDWVSQLNPEIPLHFSRYFPKYMMEEPPTPASTLERAYRIAKKKMHFVYIGNVNHHESFNTHCFQCGALLLSRIGYSTHNEGLNGDQCRNCGTRIYGKF
ncbi:MAG TPA: AmmeMemoRadiSam system radical SAM enzyme [Candidatus Cloacimonadota bacterium]|nr:AmmeMemoRadiSam system radical SAM enzyme [Candidatus Cloacimonadota bacterium]